MNDKSKVSEAIGIKEYIRYVRQTICLLRADVLKCSDNQCKYYISVGDSIEEYAKSHKLYIKYILQKVSFDEIKDLLGEEDRQVFRWAERQRKLLIDFIQEKEIEFFAKYPFYDEIKMEGKQ